MNWIDEQLEYWQKEAYKQEQKGHGAYTTIELIRPYVEINNLLQYKIQILMSKENGNKER